MKSWLDCTVEVVSTCSVFPCHSEEVSFSTWCFWWMCRALIPVSPLLPTSLFVGPYQMPDLCKKKKKEKRRSLWNTGKLMEVNAHSIGQFTKFSPFVRYFQQSSDLCSTNTSILPWGYRGAEKRNYFPEVTNLNCHLLNIYYAPTREPVLY